MDELKNELKKMNGKQLVAYFKFNELNYKILIENTSYLPSESSISERIYCYMNELDSLPKCRCGSPRIFHKLNKGYFKTCKADNCVKVERSDKIKKTMFDEYGCHTSKLPETKQKVKQTLNERYGDSNYVNLDYRRNTMLKLYNVEHALQSDVFLEKKKITQIERYNDPNYTNIDKAKETNLRNRGVINVASDPEVKKKTRETFYINHIASLNDKLNKMGITVLSSIDGKYDFMCSCGSRRVMSNSQFNVYVRSNESPCNVCNPYKPDYRSAGEIDLFNYISSIYEGKIIHNYMKGTSKELDIYLPDINVAFEYNGVYWHNELFKDVDYHINKKMYTKELGIDLVHIFEDEWVHKCDIVKSKIRNIIGKSKRIYARKCIIQEVSLAEARKFLNDNHLQGYVGSKIKIGLYYNDELISIMTFGRPRFDKKVVGNDLELLRFCNKIGFSVIGGASRLMYYLINNYKPDRIITEANRCWSIKDDIVYDKIGFTFSHNTPPGYWYVISGMRVHRFNYRLSRLKSMGWYDEFVSKYGDEKKPTGKNIMLDKKIYRIYDCGNSVYEWKR